MAESGSPSQIECCCAALREVPHRNCPVHGEVATVSGSLNAGRDPQAGSGAPCNICGVNWPYHADACVYKRTAEALADARSALRYIEQRYGRLDGVGWGRVLGA